MVKIDLAKAFDHIEWNFIVAALSPKGLHGHFINLIYACISSRLFSVIINSQSYARFCNNMGIRQGCPLLPYIFVLSINELSSSPREAMANNQLVGITLGPNRPLIHSLMFIGDLLIWGQVSTSSFDYEGSS